MNYEIVISGFGGQGVLSMGKILAYSGIMEDKEVSWMPSYGPEQRGGTSNVTVIVSDEPVSSPVVNEYDVVIVLNQPSLDKFAPRVKKGGILIYDPALIQHKSDRKDINIDEVPATDQSLEKAAPMLKLESIIAGLKKSLPERHHKLIPLNEEAIKRGMNSLIKVN